MKKSKIKSYQYLIQRPSALQEGTSFSELIAGTSLASSTPAKPFSKLLHWARGSENPDSWPPHLKIRNLGTWVWASEKRSLATLFRVFLCKKVVESGNRAQKSVEIENRTQDLRVFSFACYQLSQIVRGESGGLGGVGRSGALKSVRW